MDLSQYETWLDQAIEEAEQGLSEGGIPIGSMLVDAQGSVIARGHNLRVQTGDTTAHAETVCMRNAGRRRDWHTMTLVSTLSPCIMCTGASLLHQIPTVVIGENETFMGAEDLMREHGVTLIHMDNERCKTLMRTFIAERPDLWNEDIGK